MTLQVSYPLEIKLVRQEKKNDEFVLTEWIKKSYLKDTFVRDFIDPILPLEKELELFKKITKAWSEIYPNNTLYFNLFFSDLTKRDESLDGKFFNIATVIDNILQKKYGEKIKEEDYKKLIDEGRYRCILDGTKKIRSISGFKLRLLRYLDSTNSDIKYKLYPIIHESRINLSLTENIYEVATNSIVDLRNDIAHGRIRRNQDSMLEIFYMAKLIALRLLLGELLTNEKDIQKIFMNVKPHIYR